MMPTSRSRRRATGPLVAGVATAASIVLAGGLLLSQTYPSRTLVYLGQVEAPEGMTPEDLEAPVSPMLVREVIHEAHDSAYDAMTLTLRDVPAVPWGDHGLADVELDRDDIYLDDALGRYVVDLADGDRAVLSLDVEMQQHLEATVARYEEPGEAVVAIDPATGRVLALVDDHMTDHVVGPDLALRAFAYAASTFKVITGAALLAGGHASPDTVTCYYGGGSGFDLDDIIPDDARDTECITLTDAMARSANIVFGRLADQNIDPEVMVEVTRRFAYETDIPFELPVDRSIADVPMDDRLEFARMSAGFRHSWHSPLHAALIQAAIANDGMMMAPTIVEEIINADGNVIYEHEPLEWRRVLEPEIAALLRQTMSETAVSGTARRYFSQRADFPGTIDVFGKTGTLSNRGMHGSNPDPYYVFTWFSGFAERDGQTIASAGLVVNTPEWWIKGSYLAAESFLAGMN